MSNQAFSLSPESAAELNRAVQKLADAAGKVARDSIVPQARLFCADLAYNTKPIGKTAASGQRLKKEIENRIDSTYVSVGAAVNMLKGKSESLARAFQRAIRKRDYAEAAKWMNQVFSSQWSVGAFDGGRLHKEQRFSKKVSKRMVIVDKGALTAYKREKVKLAGFAKGGFATAARQLGGVRGIPGFATRQNSPGRGTVSEAGGNLTVTITNNVRHIREALDAGGEARAVAFRQRAVTKVIERMATRRFKASSRSIK